MDPVAHFLFGYDTTGIYSRRRSLRCSASRGVLAKVGVDLRDRNLRGGLFVCGFGIGDVLGIRRSRDRGVGGRFVTCLFLVVCCGREEI